MNNALENLPRNSEGSLYSKAIKGGGWVFALRISQQLLSMGRLIVLAHLLTPDDFGLVGIATITIGLVSTFTQTGFHEALIQKQEQVTRRGVLAKDLLCSAHQAIETVVHLRRCRAQEDSHVGKVGHDFGAFQGRSAPAARMTSTSTT